MHRWTITDQRRNAMGNIRNAQNGKSINAMLPDGVAVVNRGPKNRGAGQCAFTVNGNCRQTGDFYEIRDAAAEYMDAE
jgi:hypothetical protein